jgi:hypothetical protein
MPKELSAEYLEELARRLSTTLCLRPMGDGRYCMNDLGYCKKDTDHMFTGSSMFNAEAVLKVAYDLRNKNDSNQ